MNSPKISNAQAILLLVAGAKGAVASTLAATTAALRKNPETILPGLTTGDMFSYLASPEETYFAGWDARAQRLSDCIEAQGVIPEHLWRHYASDLDQMPIFEAPPASHDLQNQVEQLVEDIRRIKAQFPHARPVLINLLPASIQMDLSDYQEISQLYDRLDAGEFPDLAYLIAAIFSGVPVVNFTPNKVEIAPILEAAVKQGVPIAGRDGKTGQTYLKVVLASALKARNLLVDGWYSLNILGNADGANLMDPERAAEKLGNKTTLLDDILGYRVGERYGRPSHKVHIDYYPPRGDAKEAWDVIDFRGLFGLPMSIRLNLLGRDSILAAPLAFDLARWAAALQMAGRSGPIPELGFYFKKPVGDAPPLTFQDQLSSLQRLRHECEEKIRAAASRG